MTGKILAKSSDYHVRLPVTEVNYTLAVQIRDTRGLGRRNGLYVGPEIYIRNLAVVSYT